MNYRGLKQKVNEVVNAYVKIRKKQRKLNLRIMFHRPCSRRKLFLTSVVLFTLFVCMGFKTNVALSHEQNCNRELKTIEIRKDVNIVEEKKTVVLDAGHGGIDGGSTGNGYEEKNITMDIVNILAQTLEMENIQVVFTRENDQWNWESETVDLANRVLIGEEVNADLFLSIHLNYFEDDTKGIETWVSYNDEQAYTFAQGIQNALVELAYSDDRGVKNQDIAPLYVLSQNSIPAALVEMGFISSSEDMRYLSNKDAQNQIADAMKQAILDYLENS